MPKRLTLHYRFKAMMYRRTPLILNIWCVCSVLIPRIVLLLLGFQLVSIDCAAQQLTVDSLYQVWSSNGEVPERLDALNVLCEKVMYVNPPDSTLELCARGVRVANKALESVSDALDRKRILQSKARCFLYMGMAYDIIGQLDSAYKCSEIAGDISHQIGDSVGLAEAYISLGVLSGRLTKIDKQREYLNRGIAILERSRSLKKLATALTNKAEYFESKGQVDSAKMVLARAITIGEELDDRASLAHAKMTLGFLLSSVGEAQPALENFKYALDIYTEISDVQGMAICLNNTAKIYDQQGLLSQAVDYYRRSLDLCKEIGDKFGESVVGSNIGNMYIRMNEYEKAISHYMDALDIAVINGNRKWETIINGQLGTALIRHGDWRGGMNCLKSSIAIADEIQAPNLRAHALRKMADAYWEIGEVDSAYSVLIESMSLNQRHKSMERYASDLAFGAKLLLKLGQDIKAESFAKRALNASTAIGLANVRLEALAVYGKVLKERGKYNMAYRMLRQYLSLRDSMWKQEEQIEVIKFDMVRKYKEQYFLDSCARASESVMQAFLTEEEQARSSSRKGVSENVTLLVLAMLLVAGYSIGIERRRRLQFEAFRRAHLESQVWCSQVNPNFIHTALQNINAYVQANERDLASSFLTRFARLMRAVLENARQEEVSLAADLNVMRDYLELERLRLGGQFTYSLELDPDIDPEVVMVPPMLLQPYAEQAIWGRANQQEDCVQLLIRVQQRKDSLVLTLENDLEPDASHRPGGSMRSEGTDITEARLTLLAKKGGRQASVKVMPLPGGHCVELTLPYNMAA